MLSHRPVVLIGLRVVHQMSCRQTGHEPKAAVVGANCIPSKYYSWTVIIMHAIVMFSSLCLKTKKYLHVYDFMGRPYSSLCHFYQRCTSHSAQCALVGGLTYSVQNYGGLFSRALSFISKPESPPVRQSKQASSMNIGENLSCWCVRWGAIGCSCRPSLTR